MPELPEVETQVRDLQKIIGKKIIEVATETPKAFTPKFSVFKKKLEGKKILAVSRRAKFIIFSLSGKWKLLVHFRMTGHFLIARSSQPLEKCVRHFFKISGGVWLQFSDIRKFATLRLAEEKKFRELPEFKKLGPEPLEAGFTPEKFRELISVRRGKLKAILLDQTFVAGIGNIYADEICFEAKLHPASRVEKLTQSDIEKIFHAIKNQLRKGIRNRGTTIGEYVDTRGRGGRNQNSLMAYKQHGKACKVCGNILEKMKIVQRTSSFCKNCQKLK